MEEQMYVCMFCSSMVLYWLPVADLKIKKI